MQALPGFRDFYPDACARRNYILSTWREVARRYGYVEYDGPVLEAVDPERVPARIGLIAIPNAEERHRLVASGEVEAAANLERMADPGRRADALTWTTATNTMSVMYHLDARRGPFAHPSARRAVNQSDTSRARSSARVAARSRQWFTASRRSVEMW